MGTPDAHTSEGSAPRRDAGPYRSARRVDPRARHELDEPQGAALEVIARVGSVVTYAAWLEPGQRLEAWAEAPRAYAQGVLRWLFALGAVCSAAGAVCASERSAAVRLDWLAASFVVPLVACTLWWARTAASRRAGLVVVGEVLDAPRALLVEWRGVVPVARLSPSRGDTVLEGTQRVGAGHTEAVLDEAREARWHLGTLVVTARVVPRARPPRTTLGAMALRGALGLALLALLAPALRALGRLGVRLPQREGALELDVLRVHHGVERVALAEPLPVIRRALDRRDGDPGMRATSELLSGPISSGYGGASCMPVDVPSQPYGTLPAGCVPAGDVLRTRDDWSTGRVRLEYRLRGPLARRSVRQRMREAEQRIERCWLRLGDAEPTVGLVEPPAEETLRLSIGADGASTTTLPGLAPLGIGHRSPLEACGECVLASTRFAPARGVTTVRVRLRAPRRPPQQTGPRWITRPL